MKAYRAYQLDLIPNDSALASGDKKLHSRSGTFTDNMALPVHRWYRYSAGFSADWVRSLLRDGKLGPRINAVIDPFSGIGTTLLACDAERISSYGFENHPFVNRIAVAKLRGIHVELPSLMALYDRFLNGMAGSQATKVGSESTLLEKCYSPQSLEQLCMMRDTFLNKFNEGTALSELLWLTITAILRTCSEAGTAQWQYVLPNKSKSRVEPPLGAFQTKATEILQDIEFVQANGWSRLSNPLMTDARSPRECPHLRADAVVTSPPYPNNYDYADATRLEMTFWGDVSSWGDLQSAVRRHLIRSCSQHVSAEKLNLEDLLAADELRPIREDLTTACQSLAKIREDKGGRKNYHTMAAAYFRDLALVFRALRPICKEGCTMCFVIGDSAPYGVYLNVDTWLGELALAAGFGSYGFEKIRDRNVKWKNRKHRVPLKEGRLWIKD